MASGVSGTKSRDFKLTYKKRGIYFFTNFSHRYSKSGGKIWRNLRKFLRFRIKNIQFLFSYIKKKLTFIIFQPKPINGTAQPLQNGNSIPQNAPNRPQTSCIRSKTVVNTVPLTISTDRSGFHFNMANVGRGVVRLDDSARMSPPLKRQKLTGTATNWSDYVPRHVVEKMEESRKNQLEIVRRRFEMIRAPIIPLEMVALVREEIIAEFPRLAVEEDEVVQERLLEYCELLVQR